jgi:glycosyltransferase involved in cell wall biosynthesis
MKMVKTIVALLNRNNDRRLKRCLDSLLQQSFKEAVIVVVDGGSSDNSIKILEEYAKNNSRIRFFIQKSRGTGRARNELIEYVKKHFPNAEKIVWGDSENLYHNDYLLNLLRADVDVAGGVSVIDSDCPLSQALWWYYNGFRGRSVVGNNEATKVYLFKKYKYLPITRTEDFFFHKELKKSKVKVKKVDDAICYVKTVESFSDFMKWEKSRVKGLWEGAKLTKSEFTLFATYLLAILIVFSYFALFYVLMIFSPLLMIPHASILLLISLYMWFKGRPYVKKLRIKTIFYFVPIFILDPIIVFFLLIKQLFSHFFGTQIGRRSNRM